MRTFSWRVRSTGFAPVGTSGLGQDTAHTIAAPSTSPCQHATMMFGGVPLMNCCKLIAACSCTPHSQSASGSRSTTSRLSDAARLPARRSDQNCTDASAGECTMRTPLPAEVPSSFSRATAANCAKVLTGLCGEVTVQLSRNADSERAPYQAEWVAHSCA